jgi:hypothetical protein
VVCGKEGLKEVGQDSKRHSRFLEWGHWECKTLIDKEGRNKQKCMYFVCDFNEKWLKNLSFLCCIVILLRVESRVVGNVQVGCFLEIVFLHFF